MGKWRQARKLSRKWKSGTTRFTDFFKKSLAITDGSSNDFRSVMFKQILLREKTLSISSCEIFPPDQPKPKHCTFMPARRSALTILPRPDLCWPTKLTSMSFAGRMSFRAVGEESLWIATLPLVARNDKNAASAGL